MPVITVFSRSVGDETAYISQDITLTPVACSTLDNAVEACLQASAQIKEAILQRAITGGTDVFELYPSYSGVQRVRTATLEDAVHVSITTLALQIK
jgi:hypothetical protein